jgi:hypothetical protein
MPYHSSHLVIISLLGLILLPVGIKGAGEDVITAEDLIEQVRILAAPEMEGRASGTSGGTRAAAHIAEEFRKIRLQPLGDRGDYLQLFEVATDVRLGTRNRLALDLAAGRKEYQEGIIIVTDPNHADAERARLFGLRGGGSTSAGIVAVNTVAEWVHPRFLRVVDSWGETGGRET